VYVVQVWTLDSGLPRAASTPTNQTLKRDRRCQGPNAGVGKRGEWLWGFGLDWTISPSSNIRLVVEWKCARHSAWSLPCADSGWFNFMTFDFRGISDILARQSAVRQGATRESGLVALKRKRLKQTDMDGHIATAVLPGILFLNSTTKFFVLVTFTSPRFRRRVLGNPHRRSRNMNGLVFHRSAARPAARQSQINGSFGFLSPAR